MNKCVAMTAIFGFKDITHSHYITLHITQCGCSFMYMLLLIGGSAIKILGAMSKWSFLQILG